MVYFEYISELHKHFQTKSIMNNHIMKTSTCNQLSLIRLGLFSRCKFGEKKKIQSSNGKTDYPKNVKIFINQLLLHNLI